MDHERFMRAALELAAENARAGQGGPFGALVVKDGVIIGRGSNSVVPRNDPTAHAEVQAIRAACMALGTFQLTDCDVYTSCEPCPMCLGALYWARPRAVYYAATCAQAAAAGFDDTLIYDELACSLEVRRLPFKRLLADEAGAPFAAWLANPNRVEY